MRPGALGAKHGGDGIPYHSAILPDGSIHEHRADTDVLSHSGHLQGKRLGHLRRGPAAAGKRIPGHLDRQEGTGQAAG